MRAAAIWIALLTAVPVSTVAHAQRVSASDSARQVTNALGLRLVVANENSDPLLRVVLPAYQPSDQGISILFPEHITAVRRGGAAATQLYMFRPGRTGEPPLWRKVGNSVEYKRSLADGLTFLARATLEEDGILVHYEFTNQSGNAYDMIYAVTDPRLTGLFHDQRLERTFVHHADGFDLLASETPARLTLPLSQWLPARYLASFTWTIPQQRVEVRDGIPYYNKSRAVDEPFIATRSSDAAWVVASFSRDAGNVWSNPALTCQHVDPQTSLAPGEHKVLEMKMLILRGSLEMALERAREQRYLLKG